PPPSTLFPYTTLFRSPNLTKAMRSPRPSPRRLALLGATGSIGRQVCDLVERHPDRFALHALIAGSDAAALHALARRHPEAHALRSEEHTSELQSRENL